jgi:DNA polymerase-3 subunit alpha
MEKFVHTHIHTVYSTYDAVNTPEQMVEQAVKHNHQAVAITDHGVMGGTYSFQQACIKNGIKPLLGMEGYAVSKLVDEDDKGKRIRLKNNHLILIAKDEDGWKSLLKLNYLSNSDDEHFYYKPRFTFKELFENKKGLIVSSACLASPFANLLKLGKEKEAIELFEKFCQEFGEDFYAELQLNEIQEQKAYNSWLIAQATHYGVPLTIAGDCHYAVPEGAAAQEMAFRIRNDSENEVGQTFACRNLYYHGIDDFKKFNREWNYGYTDEQIDSWCANTYDLSNKVNFVIPERKKMRLPRQAFDEDGELITKAKKGLCEYFNVKTFEECPEEYRKRLEFELQLMVKKGIARYFLVLMDILNWCDANKISHGIARGSAGGSLVSMCLGVTGKIMDPVKNGLLFERFISNERLVDCYIDYSKKGNE